MPHYIRVLKCIFRNPKKARAINSIVCSIQWLSKGRAEIKQCSAERGREYKHRSASRNIKRFTSPHNLRWQQVDTQDRGVKRCGRWQSNKFASTKQMFRFLFFESRLKCKQNPRSPSIVSSLLFFSCICSADSGFFSNFFSSCRMM